ncbi:MAG TPA: hypothetical protein VEY30_13435 [Myxococcaceae bacterium]|nr:hypothetical protein [Myxococcaceae bacterium]
MLALLLAATASTAPSVSANGLYSIQFERHADGTCRIAVAKESQPHWHLDRCVGGLHDLFFVSNNGERFWVLLPLPEKVKGAWPRTVVAILYGRGGEVLEEKRLEALVSKPGRFNVRQLDRHFSWLQGTAQHRGAPPRVTAENRVELSTVEPKTLTLAFEKEL